GERDDITSHEQVFAAETLCGTPKAQIEKRIVPGGHVGLFMGARTLRKIWPEIATWIPKPR
ncbi:MAG: alpha/beta fold hydrolase, partial [Candidatus Dormibacteria bacterium]